MGSREIGHSVENPPSITDQTFRRSSIAYNTYMYVFIIRAKGVLVTYALPHTVAQATAVGIYIYI